MRVWSGMNRTHLKNIRSKPIQDTRVQTRLALRHEPDSCLPLVGIRNEPAIHRRAAHLRLLRALPAVRVREHKLDVVLDRAPQAGPVRVRVDDERARAAEEVREEVAEDVDRGLVPRERREAHAVHLELHGFRAQTQFEAGGCDKGCGVNE